MRFVTDLQQPLIVAGANIAEASAVNQSARLAGSEIFQAVPIQDQFGTTLMRSGAPKMALAFILQPGNCA